MTRISLALALVGSALLSGCGGPPAQSDVAKIVSEMQVGWPPQSGRASLVKFEGCQVLNQDNSMYMCGAVVNINGVVTREMPLVVGKVDGKWQKIGL